MNVNTFKIALINVSKHQMKVYSTVKRKYPLNPEELKTLPVFEYPVSKSTYNRVYVWGCMKTGALGVPYRRKKDILETVECIRNPKRLSFAEKHEIITAACGFGFTLYGVRTQSNLKLYGTGLNTDSQIGYHSIRPGKPLEIIFFPQPIHLPLNSPEKNQIKKISAGRAHALVLTDEGLFLLGNNAYGQGGREIIEDENYSSSRYIHHISKIDSKRIIDIECGQDHSMAITEDGCVYSCGWGADGQTGLGHFNTTAHFTRLEGDIASENVVKISCRGDFVIALNDKGDVFGWGNTEYSQIKTPDNSQQISNPTCIKMCKSLGKIEDVAAGGSFCAVMNEHKHVFVWGFGLLGHGPQVQESSTPVFIPSTLFGLNNFQPDNYVQSIKCGLCHLTAITNRGDLYVWGRNRYSCLGLGHDKDQSFPLKVSLGGYVKEVYCGVDHTVALCKPYI